MTPAGIEPATFRFVAQPLNHCATAVPEWSTKSEKKVAQTEGKASAAVCWLRPRIPIGSLPFTSSGVVLLHISNNLVSDSYILSPKKG